MRFQIPRNSYGMAASFLEISVNHSVAEIVLDACEGSDNRGISMNATAIRQHLRTDFSPFVLKRTEGRPSVSDLEKHRAAFERDPERYALDVLAADVQPAQRARAVYHLLRRTRSAIATETDKLLDRVTNLIAACTPADDTLTVFLTLRRQRVNRKTVSQFILQYILNHPCLEDLAARRRPAVVDCIEHAVGRNVARACVKALRSGNGADTTYADKHLLRFAQDRQRATAVLRSLYEKAEARQLAKSGRYDLYHSRFEAAKPAAERTPKTVTATNRGDIAATLIHLYRGGDNAQLSEALNKYVECRAAGMPRFEGTVSLVMDLSASTRGYGEREYCCVSQSVAFQLVLERCCERLHVHPVGGSETPPRPSGETDLASAVLDAVEDNPDVVAIVSDGFENVQGGDLARVVASLERLGIDIPIVFCHCKFSQKDALDLRRPAPALSELEFWHEQNFEGVIESLFSTARGDAGRRFLRNRLIENITRREQEVQVWTKRNWLI